MQILSIGNSFSQDAHRYIHRIARVDGVELTTCNLYIGGCPLSTHYRNMLSERSPYTLEFNGENTGFFVSIKEALLNRDWDVVTLQQVSSLSPYYESYQPYLEAIAEYVRKYVPKAKLAIHQTWAYAPESEKLTEVMGFSTHSEMFVAVEGAYRKAAKDISADIVITAGALMNALLQAGAEKIHRDPIHASFGLGRYALGLLWYAILTEKDIYKNSFSDFDEPIRPEEIELAKRCVKEILEKYR